MIEQNKYTAETIHLSNWILNTDKVDLVELARRAAYDSSGHGYFVSVFTDYLQSAIELIITRTASGDARGLFNSIPAAYSIPASDEAYRLSKPDDFVIRSFVGIVVQRVSFRDVVTLVLQQRPELRPATAVAA